MEKLKLYIEKEIPMMRGCKGLKRILAFRNAMLHYPEYNAVFLLRYCYVFMNATGIQKRIMLHFKRVLINRYGIYLNIRKENTIGIGLKLPHPNSIVIGAGVNIGENCVIYQNVTIGAKKRGSCKEENAYPQIGNNCVLYSGSVVIGPVRVADYTAIGANSVLLTDTEYNSIYAGIPATRKDI